jgi:2-oxo-4-hydroxy-4-carboxy-5-ureidoimidazoline decarboxylase
MGRAANRHRTALDRQASLAGGGMTLPELNALEPRRFVTALAGVFEHSPWIAASACERRPFRTVDELHAAMMEIVYDAPIEAQLALLRAHPELASQAAMRGELTAPSNKEQADAGLTHCTAAEFARLCALNRAYDAKFGFPFIIAVKGLTREEIIGRCAERLERDRDAEFAAALSEVARIARFRLETLVGTEAPRPKSKRGRLR